MFKPRIVLRPKYVRERHIPTGQTEFEYIMKHYLDVVPLTPKGRAKGITLDSVIRYQHQIMKLEPLPDGEAAVVANPGQREP